MGHQHWGKTLDSSGLTQGFQRDYDRYIQGIQSAVDTDWDISSCMTSHRASCLLLGEPRKGQGCASTRASSGEHTHVTFTQLVEDG